MPRGRQQCPLRRIFEVRSDCFKTKMKMFGSENNTRTVQQEREAMHEKVRVAPLGSQTHY